MPFPLFTRRSLRRSAAVLLVLAAAAGGAVIAAETSKPGNIVGIANPASVACGKRGGKTEIRTEADGGQAGYCHLPDGRICEEWALFRDDRCVLPRR